MNLTYIERLMADAGLVELCHMKGGRIRSTWHRDTDSLIATATQAEGTGNLFTSLNRIDPGALAAHIQQATQAGKTARTPDSCVSRYCRIFFDLDPARPRGQSSTDDELTAAQVRAHGLKTRLAVFGWPEPLMARSGNGWHLQYRTALANTPETGEMLRLIYDGLAKEFGDDEVEFDRSVRNPARLCTLYGSWKRKGSNHPDRPHRQSLALIPADWRQVHPRQVEGLANLFARQSRPRVMGATRSPTTALPPGGKGDYASLDVTAWFSAHGLYVGPLAGHIHGVRCPWQDEHTSPSPKTASDCVIFASAGDGWPGFHCKHSHCAGRDIKDVMRLWGDADGFCAAGFQTRRAA